MTLTLEQLLAVGAAIIGIVAWGIRIEGRVNTQRELAARIEDDVKYIRGRLDDLPAAQVKGRGRERERDPDWRHE